MPALWINDDYWICTEHMRAVRLPASADSCWYAGCKSHRPTKDSEGDHAYEKGVYEARHKQRLKRGERSLHSDALAPDQILEKARQAEEAARRPTAEEAEPEPEVTTCEWHKCDNEAREGSKYCSRKCSNKNARARYLKRQRNKKAGAPDTGKAAKTGKKDRSAA